MEIAGYVCMYMELERCGDQIFFWGEGCEWLVGLGRRAIWRERYW